MTQLAFESLLTEGCRRMRYFAGYSFSLKQRIGWPFAHAVVTTPRWATRAQQESALPLVLDNGAYPAWVRGEALPYDAQVSAMLDVLDVMPVSWLVLPDVVGDGDESWERTMRAVPLFAGRARCFVAVQEGTDLDAACELARDVGGVFVGGKDWAFKRETTRTLSGRGVYVHVARISIDSALWFCASHGVESFDNTTFVRGFDCNQLPDYRRRLSRYATPRGKT